MDIIYSIIAGIIQGLTEFLPVSSSGHLVLFHDFLNFNLPDDLAFDVVLHLGTLLALVIFFWKEIWYLLLAWLKSFTNWNLKESANQRLAWYLFVATIPAAVVGYFLESSIENFFRSSALVAVMLIVFGILLYFADRFFSKDRNIEQMNLNNALVVGIAQVAALIPGVSRSGITIIAGLSQKLNRGQAAHFAFLLSIPIVFGAGFKKTVDLFGQNILVSSDVTLLILGFLSSLITGYFCIKYFLKFLENHSLKFFAYYRIILGTAILTFLVFN